MEPLLLYLLKAHLALALGTAAYYGLLRRLTFFGLNRGFLLGVLGFAALYPLLPVPALLPAAGPLVAAPVGSLPAAAGPLPAGAGVSLGFGAWVLRGAALLYGLGAAGLLLRLLGQLLSLAWLRRRSRPAVVQGQAVRVLPGAGGAFSFGRTIYLGDKLLADSVALPAALRHEQAHVGQGHTLDVLLAHVATALAWPNPAVWLLRRAVLANLEFLADRAALAANAGLDRRAYQLCLVQQQTGAAPALAFSFFSHPLKNRIFMLNQPLSPARQLGRYALAASLTLALALGYAGARAQTGPGQSSAGTIRYYVDGQLATKEAALKLDPATILSMQTLMGLQARSFAREKLADNAAITVITTKPNAQTAAVQALNQRVSTALAAVESASTAELPPAALAYITSHYPGYRLVEVGRQNAAANQPLLYQATIALGRRPMYLVFDEKGQPAKL